MKRIIYKIDELEVAAIETDANKKFSELTASRHELKLRFMISRTMRSMIWIATYHARQRNSWLSQFMSIYA